MNFNWAICLPREDAAALAGMRLLEGLEVAEAGARLWLRGPRGDEKLARRLAAVPATDRFEWLGSNQLRRIDHRIPAPALPELRWQPLSAWLRVELPPAALPGQPPPAQPLRLVRSTQEQEADLLLTTVEALAAFTREAAQVRLDRLQFAANDAGAALVRGKPLPPLPGRRFVLWRGVAVPAGFGWEPGVSAEVLARCMGATDETIVLWSEASTVSRLHQEQFLPASRSAVRATARALVEP